VRDRNTSCTKNANNVDGPHGGAEGVDHLYDVAEAEELPPWVAVAWLHSEVSSIDHMIELLTAAANAQLAAKAYVRACSENSVSPSARGGQAGNSAGRARCTVRGARCVVRGAWCTVRVWCVVRAVVVHDGVLATRVGLDAAEPALLAFPRVARGVLAHLIAHLNEGGSEMHSAWCTVRGAWWVVCGAWCTVRGTWCTVHGAWCVVGARGAWCVVRGEGGGGPCTSQIKFATPDVARSP
jgi:hypothetical protein